MCPSQSPSLQSDCGVGTKYDADNINKHEVQVSSQSVDVGLPEVLEACQQRRHIGVDHIALEETPVSDTLWVRVPSSTYNIFESVSPSERATARSANVTILLLRLDPQTASARANVTSKPGIQKRGEVCTSNVHGDRVEGQIQRLYAACNSTRRTVLLCLYAFKGQGT